MQNLFFFLVFLLKHHFHFYFILLVLIFKIFQIMKKININMIYKIIETINKDALLDNDYPQNIFDSLIHLPMVLEIVF